MRDDIFDWCDGLECVPEADLTSFINNLEINNESLKNKIKYDLELYLIDKKLKAFVNTFKKSRKTGKKKKKQETETE